MDNPDDLSAEAESGPLDDALTALSGVVGAVAAVGVGTAVVGPAGAFAGAAVGPVLTATLLHVGRDAKRRLLSRREEERIATALQVADTVIRERLSRGETPRSDGFFNARPGEMPAAEELLEGVLLSAQREHEAQKVPFLGNLYAALCFDSTVTKAEANHLLRIAERLSYQQLLLLQSFAREASKEPVRSKPRSIDVQTAHVLSEVYDLYLQGLVRNGDIATFSYADLVPSHVQSQGVGNRLLLLMGLDRVTEAGELNRLTALLARYEQHAFEPSPM